MSKKTIYTVIVLAIIVLLACIAIKWYKKRNSTTTNNQLVTATRQIENECEKLFNTQAEVENCIKQKLAT